MNEVDRSPGGRNGLLHFNSANVFIYIIHHIVIIIMIPFFFSYKLFICCGPVCVCGVKFILLLLYTFFTAFDACQTLVCAYGDVMPRG